MELVTTTASKQAELILKRKIWFRLVPKLSTWWRTVAKIMSCLSSYPAMCVNKITCAWKGFDNPKNYNKLEHDKI